MLSGFYLLNCSVRSSREAVDRQTEEMRKGRDLSPLGQPEVTDAKLQQKEDKHLSCLQQLHAGKIRAMEEWTAPSLKKHRLG